MTMPRDVDIRFDAADLWGPDIDVQTHRSEDWGAVYDMKRREDLLNKLAQQQPEYFPQGVPAEWYHAMPSNKYSHVQANPDYNVDIGQDLALQDLQQQHPDLFPEDMLDAGPSRYEEFWWGPELEQRYLEDPSYLKQLRDETYEAGGKAPELKVAQGRKKPSPSFA